MEVTRFSETLVHVRTKRRYISEDGYIRIYYCENFKSYISYRLFPSACKSQSLRQHCGLQEWIPFPVWIGTFLFGIMFRSLLVSTHPFCNIIGEGVKTFFTAKNNGETLVRPHVFNLYQYLNMWSFLNTPPLHYYMAFSFCLQWVARISVSGSFRSGYSEATLLHYKTKQTNYEQMQEVIMIGGTNYKHVKLAF
jgi:hypothetical protein